MDPNLKIILKGITLQVALAIFIPYILSRKHTALKKFVIFNTTVIIISCFIAIYHYTKSTNESLIQLILQGEILLFLSLMLISYIVSLIFLFKKSAQHLSSSFSTFFLGYIFFWVGALLNEEQIKFDSESLIITLITLSILPIINSSVYPTLISNQPREIEVFGDIFKIRAVKNILVKIIIFFLMLCIIAVIFDTFKIIEEHLLISLVLIITYIFCIKFMYTYIIYGMDIDFKEQQITQYKTFSKNVIKAKEIKNWGIREYIPHNPAYVSISFLEIEILNGKTIYYPLMFTNKNKTSMDELVLAFRKISDIEPKSFPITNPTAFSKSYWWQFTF